MEDWERCLLKDEVLDWESVSEEFELKMAIAVGAELCADLPKILSMIEGRSAIAVAELKSLLKNWEIKFASKLLKADLLVAVCENLVALHVPRADAVLLLLRAAKRTADDARVAATGSVLVGGGGDGGAGAATGVLVRGGVGGVMDVEDAGGDDDDDG